MSNMIKTLNLCRSDDLKLCYAELRICADERHPVMRGKSDESLVFHATKLAELLMPYYSYGENNARAELIFDGAFVAVRIVNVTTDIERPGT